MFQGFIIVFGETGTQQKHASVQILINMTIKCLAKEFHYCSFSFKASFSQIKSDEIWRGSV